ncbi:MAG TPA: Fic family protein [Pseudomonas xinjiangensis]|uniref:Fic family protein n=2 Tax=root TaxID=1 RepID=A0A7V1BPE7_9GAMM|nr:Fic family protein [Halopseudomonas xinjiangensis]HEC48127.1 Fic family protein [Halopseudomonas xinjiangensis]
MVKRPPALIENPFAQLSVQQSNLIGEYLELFTPLDDKGRYQHFDELRFRIPKELDHSLAWSVVKQARQRQLNPIIPLGEPEQLGKLLLTPAMQMAMAEADRHTSRAALEWISGNIGELQHVQYLLKDLVEDEAISSSQLEGAATTTKVAKALLKRQLGPRSPDEKMIVGNFRLMQFAWNQRHKPLSTELITEMHRVGVEGIDDDKYQPGALRADDEVVVVDAEGNIVHTPPPAKGLERRLTKLAKWANGNHHDVESSQYLHPLLKAIVLHFAIGFEHPFRDGNGRVARSLFYWYLFKQDFAAFRYIAISTLLKAAPVQYGKSYLFTETDEMDLTYFIDYQCRVITRAIAEFKSACQRAMDNIQTFNTFLYESGLYRELSDKQKTVLQVAKNGIASQFTAANVKENLGCSYNTAASVLNGLVQKKLFKKEKSGREWIYSMVDVDRIVQDWKS